MFRMYDIVAEAHGFCVESDKDVNEMESVCVSVARIDC